MVNYNLSAYHSRIKNVAYIGTLHSFIHYRLYLGGSLLFKSAYFQRKVKFLHHNPSSKYLQKAEAALAYELQAAKIKQRIRNEEIQIEVVERRKQIEVSLGLICYTLYLIIKGFVLYPVNVCCIMDTHSLIYEIAYVDFWQRFRHVFCAFDRICNVRLILFSIPSNKCFISANTKFSGM